MQKVVIVVVAVALDIGQSLFPKTAKNSPAGAIAIALLVVINSPVTTCVDVL